jgi:hypothetical protein
MDNIIQIIVYKHARELEYSCKTVLNPCCEEKEEGQVGQPEYPVRGLKQRTFSDVELNTRFESTSSWLYHGGGLHTLVYCIPPNPHRY